MPRLILTAMFLLIGLSACSTALPNGAAPVSSLYSYGDSARFFLGDVCLPSAAQSVPVGRRADVPAVRTGELTAAEQARGALAAWRAGPAGAARLTDEGFVNGGRACRVSVDRGIPQDLRRGLIAEIEQSPLDFRLSGEEMGRGPITQLFCASGRGPYPPGLSVLLETAQDYEPKDVRISADVRPRPTCGGPL